MTLRKLPGTKIAWLGAFGLLTMMPQAPALAGGDPCELAAYKICRDGGWAAEGYSSYLECMQWESSFCPTYAGASQQEPWLLYRRS
jgi:hypothetical protein